MPASITFHSDICCHNTDLNMLKLVVLSALLAVAVAMPGFLHGGVTTYTAPSATVHYAATPVVTGYTSTVYKPQLGALATPTEVVSQEKVLAPGRSVATVTPQVTQVQPEITVRKVPVDVPVATPVVNKVTVHAAPAVTTYTAAAPAVTTYAAAVPAVTSYAAPAPAVAAPAVTTYAAAVPAVTSYAAPAPAVAAVHATPIGGVHFKAFAAAPAVASVHATSIGGVHVKALATPAVAYNTVHVKTFADGLI